MRGDQKFLLKIFSFIHTPYWFLRLPAAQPPLPLVSSSSITGRYFCRFHCKSKFQWFFIVVVVVVVVIIIIINVIIIFLHQIALQSLLRTLLVREFVSGNSFSHCFCVWWGSLQTAIYKDTKVQLGLFVINYAKRKKKTEELEQKKTAKTTHQKELNQSFFFFFFQNDCDYCLKDKNNREQ